MIKNAALFHLRYIRNDECAAFEAAGWTIEKELPSLLGGGYSHMIRWTGVGSPPEPLKMEA